MRYFVILFLCKSCLILNAQDLSDDIFEKRQIDFKLGLETPLGKYASKLSNDFISNNSLSFGIDYFFNPMYKKGNLSQVFIGFDSQIQSQNQKDFIVPSEKYDFYANYQAFSFIPSIRFLPIVFPKKFLFYIQGGIGPVFIQNKIMENLGQGESQRYYAYSSNSWLSKVKMGTSFNIKKKRKNYRFIGVYLSYESSNKTKFWDRKTLQFDAVDNVQAQTLVGNLQNLNIGLNFSIIR